MNILTFDIEEWFHILDNTSTKTMKEWSNYEYRIEANMDKIFKLLIDKKQKATFFVLGWIAQEFPHIVKKINDLGFEIGSHSNQHQLVYEQSPSEFRNDLKRSIYLIEDIIGKKVRSYRAPGFSITPKTIWAFEELINYGIEIDCSVFPANRAHGGFPNYGESNPSIISLNGRELKEFPINLYNFLNKKIIFSGGGYFRLTPTWLLKKLMKSNYVMTYFHPRDFDPEQPVITDLSLKRRFKSYIGLKGAFGKLETLLSLFHFIDLTTAEKKVNWKNSKVVKLT